MSQGSEAHGHLLVRYQDWSGCLVEFPGKAAAPLVAFDPAPGHSLPDRPMVILITHGHPEHVEGAAAHLAKARRSAVRVIASPSVCRYLKRRSRNLSDEFHPVKAGESVATPGLHIDAFAWNHMPLLPEGWAEKARYLKKLSSRPHSLAGIALGGLGGPAHGPMIGFILQTTAGARLVYFGEGLHRKTAPALLRECLGTKHVDVLLSAVEPEDCACLPELISPYPIREFLAFEAHRNWREKFGLPQADLPALAARVRSGEGLRMRPLKPGDAVELPFGEGANAAR